MSFLYEETRPRGEAGSESSGGKPQAKSKFNRPAAKPTQLERVRSMLLDGWVCGTDFLAAYLPRHSPRIHELRKAGYLIDRRRCEHPYHEHESAQYQWTIVGVPGYAEGEPCPGCGSRLSHTSDCRFRELAESEGRLFQ